MELKRNTLYICFHKPKRLIGHLIALWTLGKYSHAEFVYNDYVFLANPGGVRMSPFIHKNNIDIYELDKNISATDVLEFFVANKGKGYDYLGILGQFFYAGKVQDDDRYFCSEFCLNAIDYALQFTLTYKMKSLKDRVGYDFNPSNLYKYLKEMELIKEKEVEWMDIRNLIGIEIMEQGKLLKVTDAMLEGDNIVLITETVEKAKKDIKETKKGKWFKWTDLKEYLTTC